MEASGEVAGRAAHIDLAGDEISVSTGISVLDHFIALTARAGGFGLALELAPDDPEIEVDEAGRALGRALRPLLAADGARGFGTGLMPAEEALAVVALEAAERPLLVSNADLSQSRVGGLATDVGARFLQQLADTAGLVIHVRLLEGDDSQHVLEAIFKALGVALSGACRIRERG